MNQSQQIELLSAALVEAQKEMPVVAFDSTNPFLKNKYASLGAVIDTSRPVLHKHGLAVSQLPVSEGELIGVETVLTHASGQFISNRILLHPGDEKGKSVAQVAGSIITYLRRYSWAAALGIYADEDTDGELPERKAPAPRQTPAARGAAPATAAAAKPPPRPPASAPAEAPEDKLARFIAQCRTAGGGDDSIAVTLFIEMGWLLENEGLDALSVNRVPKTKAEADNIIEEIRTRLQAGDQVPGAETPPPPPRPAARPAPPPRPAAPAPPPTPDNAEQITGFIKKVTKKPSGRGFRYGILFVQDLNDRDGGDWLNTFSDTDGGIAEGLIERWTTAFYTTSQFGKDLVKGSLAEVQ